MLEGYIYQVVKREAGRVSVRLLADSPIYAAHFPGQPITPGVVLLQMALEVTQRELVQARNIKFLVPVAPAPDGPVLQFSWTEAAGQTDISVSFPDGTLIARMSLLTRDPRYVVVIPTYNNAGTVKDVVERVQAIGLPVLVVNDGSTDGTKNLLSALPGITLVTLSRNQGKGRALRVGFEKARELGYRFALTIDADGQHFPEDIPALLDAAGENSLVVGSRNIRADGMASSSTFANRFSNGTFTFLTLCRLPDTQTGFRLYPLDRLPSLSVLSARYEAEVILLVFSAWKGIELKPVPVRVIYPEDRISHFRPTADFLRIFVTYWILFVIAVFYGWPRTLFRRIFKNVSHR